MVEQELKFWSLKKFKGRETPHLLETPIELEKTEEMTRPAFALNDALRKIILGQAIDVPINEIATAVRNALRKAGHETPQILTMAVNGLALERKCLTAKPQDRKKSKESGQKRKPTRIRDMMAKAARPSPVFDPENKTYKILGRWAYDPENQNLFIDGQYTPTPLPYVAVAVGELIDRFPAPLTIEEIETIAISNLEPGQTSYSTQMLEKFFNDFIRKLKRDKIFDHKPIVKTGPEGAGYSVITDLDALSPQQLQSLDLTTINNVSVSEDRRTIWQNGKVVSDLAITVPQLTQINFFISRYGKYVDRDDAHQQLEKFTSSKAAAINKKLSALGLPKIQIEKMPHPDNRIMGFAMCTNDEWEDLLKSRLPIKVQSQNHGMPSMPDDANFAPQFL